MLLDRKPHIVPRPCSFVTALFRRQLVCSTCLDELTNYNVHTLPVEKRYHETNL